MRHPGGESNIPPSGAWSWCGPWLPASPAPAPPRTAHPPRRRAVAQCTKCWLSGLGDTPRKSFSLVSEMSSRSQRRGARDEGWLRCDTAARRGVRAGRAVLNHGGMERARVVAAEGAARGRRGVVAASRRIPAARSVPRIWLAVSQTRRGQLCRLCQTGGRVAAVWLPCGSPWQASIRLRDSILRELHGAGIPGAFTEGKMARV